MYQYTKLFPKKDRYSLGGKLETNTLLILESIIFASQTKGEKKISVLEDASVKLDILKILIRLGKDIQVLDNKKYLELQTLLQEIGKMLGGWLRSAKQNT